MNKKLKKILISSILTTSFFGIKVNNTYAINQEIDLDLLIKNKNIQNELQLEISELEKKLDIIVEDTKKYNEEENDLVEVVSISFIKETESSVQYNKQDELENEVNKIKKEKVDLEKQLEEKMIEGIKIEKILESQTKQYLESNDLTFIEGIWPVPSYTDISSPFGERIHPITGKNTFHKGIDIPAPENVDIVSSNDGIVTFSGVKNGYGNVVEIKHFDGKKTVYAHNNLNVVKNGDIVKQGDTIAKIGSTGKSTGNHVHFETILNEENVNPVNIVN